MSIASYDLRRAIFLLRLIFLGGLICVLDFKVNQFDVVNDVVGMVMVTWGVFQMSKFEVHARYSKAMLFIKIVAVLSCFKAFYDQCPYQAPSSLSSIVSLIGFMTIVAIVVFCIAMRWFSIEANLRTSAKSWKTTTWLFTIIYLIPAGISYCAVAVIRPPEGTINLDLGPAGLLLPPIFFAPIIHLFMSISRMKNEARLQPGN